MKCDITAIIILSATYPNQLDSMIDVRMYFTFFIELEKKSVALRLCFIFICIPCSDYYIPVHGTEI